MQRANNKLFYVVFSILIVAASFFVDFYLLVPNYKLIRADLSTTESQANAAAAKKTTLDQSKLDLDSIGSALSDVLVAVPSTKDTSNTISELEAIAKKNNSTIPTISVKDSTIGSGNAAALSNKVDVSLAVNGTFNDLNSVIADIESDLKFFEIKSFGFSSSDSSSTLSLQLVTYKQSKDFSLLGMNTLPENQN